MRQAGRPRYLFRKKRPSFPKAALRLRELILFARRGGRSRRCAAAAVGGNDDARDLIGGVEIRVARLVAFHQAVNLAFEDCGRRRRVCRASNRLRLR